MKKLFITSFILLAFANQSFACSCGDMTGKAKQALKEASLVFLGIPTTDSTLTGVDTEFGKEVRTNFKVIKSLKAAKNDVTVYSDQGDGANCGLSFKSNDSLVLVFAYEHQGKLYSESCSVASGSYSVALLLELL